MGNDLGVKEKNGNVYIYPIHILRSSLGSESQMKKSVKVWGLIVILMLAGSAFSWAAGANVAADNDNWESVAQGNIGGSSFNVTVSVTRDLPDTPVYPGKEINVSLTQSGFFMNHGIVTEHLPEGFTCTGLASGSGGEISKYDKITNNLTIGFGSETTVTYIVETGTAEQIETAVFSGTWSTIDSQGEKISGDVEGDTTLTLAEHTPVFDTISGTYPSISGVHNGTIKPNKTITVSKLYTYPCLGTGGHTEYARIWNNSGLDATAIWNGYKGDWHNISFNETFVLYKNKTYYYTICTGSYPQIIHETPSSAVAEPTIFFGEDSGLGEGDRLTSTPNADAARADFLAQLTNPGTENFESFADGAVAPLAVDFGAAGTATLQGTGEIEEVPDGTNGYGRYPISGDKYWETSDVIYIEFTEPQAAFGFYGVDVGDFSGQLTITYEDGSTQKVTIPHTMNSPGGTVIYFGFIDLDNPFTTATFGNTAPGTDYFGFDDFTIGTKEQVVFTITATGGTITCTEFTDANGKKYNNWIPAIRLWAE